MADAPERHDHLKDLRAPQEPPMVNDADAPRVSLDLVEYLEGKFRQMDSSINFIPTGLDDALKVSHQFAVMAGRMSVLSHLRSLAEGAPSGVHP